MAKPDSIDPRIMDSAKEGSRTLGLRRLPESICHGWGDNRPFIKRYAGKRNCFALGDTVADLDAV